MAYANGDGTYGVDTARDSRGWFLTALGMVVPDDVTALGTDEFFADFSGERIGLLDVDMLWWAGSPSSVKDGSLYARLDVVPKSVVVRASLEAGRCYTPQLPRGGPDEIAR